MIDLDQAFGAMSVERAEPPYRVAWTLPSTLPYFDGHFPGNPIFPAVGIVDASLHALGRVLARTVDVDTIGSAKFTQVLGPDVPIVMSFESTAANAWTIDWTLRDTDQTVATLSLSLRKEP